MGGLTGWDLGGMIQGLRDAADSHKDQVAITRQRLVEAADALEAMAEESGRLRAMASANQGAIVNSIIERTNPEKLDYYDPARQNLVSEHDCDYEDGEWWFGHGMPCKHPGLHVQPQREPSDSQVEAAMREASRRSLMWRTSADVRAILIAAGEGAHG